MTDKDEAVPENDELVSTQSGGGDEAGSAESFNNYENSEQIDNGAAYWTTNNYDASSTPNDLPDPKLVLIQPKSTSVQNEYRPDDDDGDEDDDGGSGEGSSSSAIKEQDRFLPIANISRIMKKAIPHNGKMARDAKECVQECASEFISFITSEASDRCHQEKRKTINGEDILWAMQSLGFDAYIEPLKNYLQQYRESVKGIGDKRDIHVGEDGMQGFMGQPMQGGMLGGYIDQNALSLAEQQQYQHQLEYQQQLLYNQQYQQQMQHGRMGYQ